MLLPKEFDNIEYYGRGPMPTYQDRIYERIGIYKITVNGMWVDYSDPQENGNRTGVRWVALTNEEGRGPTVSA